MDLRAAWLDAQQAAACFAVDPVGLGGVVLRAPAGPVRVDWLAGLRALLPADTPWRRVPLDVADGRLLGGLDLAATLRAGRPVAERGLLAEADGGVVLLPMAERVGAGAAGRIAAALDEGCVRVERDGIAAQLTARFGVVALDEGQDEERLPAALRERLAVHLDLHGQRAALRADLRPAVAVAPVAPAAVHSARERLPQVDCTPTRLAVLLETAAALGIESLRAPWLALRVARAAAALDGCAAVEDEHVAFAARVVLAARATRLPAPPESPEQPPAEEPPPQTSGEPGAQQSQPLADQPLADRVLAAARAAIPASLLALLAAGARAQVARGERGGASGAAQASKRRGRPAGTRRGTPGRAGRMNLIETLRAAAPWQPLRRRERGAAADARRIEVRGDDFRVTRYLQRSQTTTVFAVDASGSAALHRLAEAKGAVELVLADCYVRRDEVALVAFRGQGAEVVLPPTRSLVRARRALAGLPGGGGTPLAAGIETALLLALSERRRGNTPLVLLLTDGRANIARDGAAGRPQAEADALAAARQARAAGLATLLIDTSPRPQPQARALAEAMGARYLPLPQAEAGAVARAAAAQPAR